MNFDPFAMQKKMFEEWEKSISEYVEKTMRDPSFMKLISQNMGNTLDLQSAIREQTENVLKTMHIPTEKTLKGLYETIHNLETRLLDLEEVLEDTKEELTQLRKAQDTEKQLSKASKKKEEEK